MVQQSEQEGRFSAAGPIINVAGIANPGLLLKAPRYEPNRFTLTRAVTGSFT